MIPAQELVERALALSTVDEAMVLVTDAAEASLRWAGNSMTTNGVSTSRSWTVLSVIRSADGFWLAIPTEAAGKGLRGGRITPGEWERRTGLRLRFIYRRSGPSLLIAEARLSKRGRAVRSRSKTGRGLTSVPIFLLVPQVRLRKRLDLERPAEAALAALSAAIARRWSEIT